MSLMAVHWTWLGKDRVDAAREEVEIACVPISGVAVDARRWGCWTGLRARTPAPSHASMAFIPASLFMSSHRQSSRLSRAWRRGSPVKAAVAGARLGASTRPLRAAACLELLQPDAERIYPMEFDKVRHPCEP